MPKFSVKSKERLLQCHPKLQHLFNTVIETTDCTVTVGYRSNEDQKIAYDEGKSKQLPGNSKHNKMPSLAVDVAPYPIDWDIKNPKKRARYYHFAGIVMGIAFMQKIDIRWGGDWDMDKDFLDQTFDDLVHFELI